MGHTCDHGRYISDNTPACPECLEIIDRREVENRAEQSAERLHGAVISLKEAIRDEPSGPEGESNEREGLRWASLAEERRRMDDLPGAIDLIDHAITCNGRFAPFHLQRARYLAAAERVVEAVTAVQSACSLDEKLVMELERLESRGALGDLSSLSDEIRTLIARIHKAAKARARKARDEARSALTAFDEAYANDAAQATIAEQKRALDLDVSEMRYAELTALPARLDAIGAQAHAAVREKVELQSRTDTAIAEVTSQLDTARRMRLSKWAPEELAAAAVQLERAKKLRDVSTLASCQEAMQAASAAHEVLQRARLLRHMTLVQERSRIELQLESLRKQAMKKAVEDEREPTIFGSRSRATPNPASSEDDARGLRFSPIVVAAAVLGGLLGTVVFRGPSFVTSWLSYTLGLLFLLLVVPAAIGLLRRLPSGSAVEHPTLTPTGRRGTARDTEPVVTIQDEISKLERRLKNLRKETANP